MKTFFRLFILGKTSDSDETKARKTGSFLLSPDRFSPLTFLAFITLARDFSSRRCYFNCYFWTVCFFPIVFVGDVWITLAILHSFADFSPWRQFCISEYNWFFLLLFSMLKVGRFDFFFFSRIYNYSRPLIYVFDLGSMDFFHFSSPQNEKINNFFFNKIKIKKKRIII